MKRTYPIVLSPDGLGFVVFVPDFRANTQGKDLTEAIEMARDLIGIMGIDMEDEKRPIPEPTCFSDIKAEEKDDIVTLVDVDFSEYRRKNEMKTVKKNCTLPSWLCHAAEKANINFSAVLQNALKKELHLDQQ